MTPTAVGILAIGMSVDAFVAALGRGAKAKRGWLAVLGTGAVFGGIEAVIAVFGWALGFLASQYVQAVDHWIAFGLLGAIGVKMITEALGPQIETASREALSLWTLVATAVGTSIDAMAVGVSLAFLQVNILIVAAAIAIATAVMAAGGMVLGRVIGKRIGRVAEFLGGVALIGLGLSILISHLFQS